ncbi:MAG: RNA-processing protein [Candidatus Aenigmarchaeota archaeon]|nr:RNA-processing protein [Candidatus Aenigmarchaeota archaeon]
MIDTVKMPADRKGVLIGKEGRTKLEIEKRTRTRIRVGEDVEIEGEPLEVMRAKEIVRAISRGFPPHKALHLLKEECTLIVIEFRESESTIKRLFARVIGRRGKIRERIEKSTGTSISVYGKTVSIIGEYEHAERASELVELLLSGRSHSYFFGRLRAIGKGL